MLPCISKYCNAELSIHVYLVCECLSHVSDKMVSTAWIAWPTHIMETSYFTTHMKESNTNLGPHINWRHSFTDQNYLKNGSKGMCTKLFKTFLKNHLDLRGLYDKSDNLWECSYLKEDTLMPTMFVYQPWKHPVCLKSCICPMVVLLLAIQPSTRISFFIVWWT